MYIKTIELNKCTKRSGEYYIYLQYLTSKEGKTMSTKGRWNQYKLLKESKRFKTFLLHTEIFNKESFYKKNHQQLIIKPSFGSNKIRVVLTSTNPEQYNVYNGEQLVVFQNKTDVFHYLSNICTKEKYYILQDFSFLNRSIEDVQEILITAHRNTSSNHWDTVDIVKKNGLLTQKERRFLRKKVIDRVIEMINYLTEHQQNCSTIVVEIGLYKRKWWVQDIFFHFSISKWSQYQILSHNNELSFYLPPTQIATSYTFLQFIEQYKQVMLKPCNGQQGKGILQISLLNEDMFEIHHETEKYRVKGIENTIQYLTNYFNNANYVVQARVDLGKIDDAIFDIRVMVQRENVESEWRITAKVVKIAVTNFIVTNVAKTVMLLEEALPTSNITGDFNDLMTTIDEISLSSAYCLSNQYSDLMNIGMDIAIDEQRNIWIIEANFKPDLALFKRLKDPGIYDKVAKIKKKENG